MFDCPCHNRLKWGAVGFCLMLCLATAPPAAADVPPPGARENKDAKKPDQDPRTLEIAIYLGILLVVAITSGFLLMLLWGARVRRQARKPLPATSPNDPLWYLKSKKSPSHEPDAPNSVSDEGTESDPPASDSAIEE